MKTQDELSLRCREYCLDLERVEEQIRYFETGFPQMDIVDAAALNRGIMFLTEQLKETYLNYWEQYCSGDVRITKFVPSSGAASRMFKDLFSYLDGEDNNPTPFVSAFISDIKKFAFYDLLNTACVKNSGLTIEELISKKDYKTVISNLFDHNGLSYGNLPKGLLLFHRYADGECRTPFLEHLSEGAAYACERDKTVNLHYTVSPEHLELFEKHLHDNVSAYGDKFAVQYNVSFSIQKKSTDTIAVNPDNTPFRDDDGSILFRPGGHGALIENLNEIDSDVVFIKNIDNVVPDRLKGITIEYKRLIGGILVSVQRQIFDYLKELDNQNITDAKLMIIRKFVQSKLNVTYPDTISKDAEIQLLRYKLNRPIRVCGMVKNEGEPGGGPFFVRGADGVVSLQILESSQIDGSYKEMLENSTYFNPVDLVCALKDYKGNKFDLRKYIDKDSGFISSKSKNGKEFKALELPGLWNGAMSDWNTIFVDVPIETFNPVKTVNDLLRPAHQ